MPVGALTSFIVCDAYRYRHFVKSGIVIDVKN